MEQEQAVQCSAKACRADARHVLVWNNPRVHAPGREKTWAACDEHRRSLSEHLDVRGFLQRVDPLPPAGSGAVPAG
jgi:hypothetical protein